MMKKIFHAAFRFFKRPPDFIIGDNYLLRWHVIPRNIWFNIYLHNLRHSDEDRALHDHTWWNISIILKGQYLEITPEGRFYRKRGAFILRKPESLHRLEIRPGQPAWSLFITGARVREWGFACPKGWVHWKDFCDTTHTGTVGRGCGEME